MVVTTLPGSHLVVQVFVEQIANSYLHMYMF